MRRTSRNLEINEKVLGRHHEDAVAALKKCIKSILGGFTALRFYWKIFNKLLRISRALGLNIP